MSGLRLAATSSSTLRARPASCALNEWDRATGGRASSAPSESADAPRPALRRAKRAFSNQSPRGISRELADVKIVFRVLFGIRADAERLDRDALAVVLARQLLREALDVALGKGWKRPEAGADDPAVLLVERREVFGQELVDGG